MGNKSDDNTVLIQGPDALRARPDTAWAWAAAEAKAPRATNIGPIQAVTEYETVSELDHLTHLEGCGWTDTGSHWAM